MPSVFTDEMGTADLKLITSAHWTIDNGATLLPNSDHYTQPVDENTPAYILDPTGIFNMSSGQPRSIHFWIHIVNNPAVNRAVLSYGTEGGASDQWQWRILITNTNTIEFSTWTRTFGGGFTNNRYSGGVSSNAWHMINIEIPAPTATSPNASIYIDKILSNASGTPFIQDVYNPGAGAVLKLGTTHDNGADLGETNFSTNTTRIAKVAFFNRLTTLAERDDWYAAMVYT